MQLSDFYSAILLDFISSYRKFYSCETALLRLTEDWTSKRDRGELVVVVSIDLSKAFDVVQHDLLLVKLKASVMGPMLFNLFINDLFYHIKWAKLNAYTDHHQIYISNVVLVALGDCVSHKFLFPLKNSIDIFWNEYR